MYLIGPIAFASPAILLALLLLPALWWLLRITPPAPRIVRFPPVRLLFGLHSEEKTPASAPLWLILLRLTIAALLILALAHPLFNPGGPLGGKGAIMLVVDDG
ncbi:MAG: BatA domain-containing protein, partial [Alphaproteobacteria bacterium]|nr:BatA domain-containing protein [Alphaproteobacteria bacterium]